MNGEDRDASRDAPPMPMYRYVVQALKIGHIKTVNNEDLKAVGAVLVPEDDRYHPVQVDGKYLAKHDPHVGGYYVVYKDGYKSFSPAEAFEDGYSLIGGAQGSGSERPILNVGDLNEMAKYLALEEEGAEEMSIAEIKELLGCIGRRWRKMNNDEMLTEIAAVVGRAGGRSD